MVFLHLLSVITGAISPLCLLIGPTRTCGFRLQAEGTASASARVEGVLQPPPAPPPREMAVTIDDLPTASVLRRDLAATERITGDLLAALERHQVYAAAYDRAGARGDSEMRDRIASAYVVYMEEVVAYHEPQSVALLVREVRQTLRMHASALNAVTFDALAGRLEGRGYRFVTPDRALLDPAYALADTYVGPGGITWLHRWALTQGKRGAFFAGEPAVPDWIQRGAQ